MAMIFPGMDPYLEAPGLWPGLHNSLIVYIRDQLRPMLRPKYVARTEEAVLAQAFEMGDYQDNLPYDLTCRPRLSDEDQAWAAELIARAAID